MSSLIDLQKDQETRLAHIERLLKLEKKKSKEKVIKVPFMIRSRIKRDDRGVMCLVLGANKKSKIKYGVIREGRIVLDNNEYGYEDSAVYFYKKIPMVVLLEHRILPVGGRVEDYKFSRVGGKEDEELANELGISNFGQQTIIRGIEQAHIDSDTKKKKPNIIIWLLIGAAVIYLLTKLFGG